MPTIHDVAKRAGVSISTVSRAFTTPDLISEDTRKRVQQAAGDLNYSPRGKDRPSLPRKAPKGIGLSRYPTPVRDTIGFQFFAAVPEDSLACNTFYAPLLSGVQMEAAATRVNLLVHTTYRHAVLSDVALMIDEASVQGILLVGATDSPVIEAIATRTPHLVLVDNHDPIHAHDCILSDGFEGGYAATRHLIELGHRRIAFFAPEIEIATFRDRQRGYSAAMIESGLPLNPELLFTRHRADGQQDDLFFTERIHAQQKNDPITAVVAANDFYAYLAIHCCRRLGIAVPQQVSVVGFDDSPNATAFDLPLTTIRVDKEAMGRLAVRRLISRIEEGRTGIIPVPSCRYVLSVNLVVRDSTLRR